MKKCLDEGVLQSFCDGELSDAFANDVTVHLSHCQACSALMSELVSENDIVSSALAAEFQEAVPTERLRQRIAGALSGANVSDTTNETASVWQRVDGWFAQLFGQRQVLGYASLLVILAFGLMFGVVYLREQKDMTKDTVAIVNEETPKPNGESTPVSSPTIQPVIQKKEDTRATVRSSQPSRTRRSTKPAVAKVKLLPGERSYLKTIANLNSTIEKASDRPMRPDLQAEYERNLAVVDRALAAARNAAKKNPNDPDAAEFVYSAYQSKVDLLNTVADARVFNRQQ
jgi:hypothetical protein